MKIFIIIYSWSIDDKVIAALTKSGLKAYTKWTKVLCCGAETEPKMGPQLWPGENDVLCGHLAGADPVAPTSCRGLQENIKVKRP